MKRRAIVNISEEYLVQLLGLDGDTEIVDAKINNFCGGTVDLLITSKGVPECGEGAYPRTYTLTTYLEEVKR